MAKKLSKALASVADWFGRRAEDSFTFYDASKRTVSWEAGHEHLVHALLGNKNPGELQHTARLLKQMFKVIGVPATIKTLPTPPVYNGQVQVPVHLLRDETGAYTMDAAKADAFIGLSIQNAALAALQTPTEYATSITAGRTKGAQFDLHKYLFTLLNVERVSKLLSDLTPGYMKFVQKYKDEQFDQNYTPLADDAGQHLRLLDLLTRLIRFPKHIGEDELAEFQKPLEAIGRLLAGYDGGIPLEQTECLEMAKKMARIVTDFVPAPPPPPPSPGPPQPEESSEDQPGECDEPQAGEHQPDSQTQSEEASDPEESENNPEDDWNKPDSQPSDADTADEDDPFAEENPQSTDSESDDDEDEEEGDGEESEQEHDEPGESGKGETDEDEADEDEQEPSDPDEEIPASDQGDSDEPEDEDGDENDSEGDSDAEFTESGNADSESDNDDADTDDEDSADDGDADSPGDNEKSDNDGQTGNSPAPETEDSPANQQDSQRPASPPAGRNSAGGGTGSDDLDNLDDDNESESEESDSTPEASPVGDGDSAESDSDQPDDGESDENSDADLDGDGTSPANESDEVADESDPSDPEPGTGDPGAAADLDGDEPDDESEGEDADEELDADGSDAETEEDEDADAAEDDELDSEAAEPTPAAPGGHTSANKIDAAGKAQKAREPTPEDPTGEPAEPLPTPPSRAERTQALDELAKALGAELFDESEELNADQTQELNNAFGELTTVPVELTPQEKFDLDMDQTGVVTGDKLYVNWNIEPGDKDVYQSVLKRIDLVKAKVLQKLFTQKKKEQEFVIKGMKSGRFDTNKLVEAKQGVPTVYERQGTVTTNKICVGVLIDESGSMSEGQDEELYARYRDCQDEVESAQLYAEYEQSSKIGKAQQAAIFLNECFGKLSDVQFFVYGHSADTKQRPQTVNHGSTDMYVYREPGTRTSPYGLGSVQYRAMNRDGQAILLAALRIRKFTQDPAILVVISDGQPNAKNYTGQAAIDDTRHQVTVVERMGFQVIQVAIEPNVPSEQMFTHFVQMTDIKTLPGDLVKYMSRKLSRMIKTKTTL